MSDISLCKKDSLEVAQSQTPQVGSHRFSGVEHLVGGSAFQKLQNSSVCIVGLGGVGSWTVEALARSGVGKLTLVDLDDICITNTNRQIQALSSTLGRSKAAVLAERVRDINPDIKLTCEQRFYTRQTADQLLARDFQVVVDCIDRVSSKVSLIANCKLRGIPVVCTGSAGQRLDPSKIHVRDLSQTEGDPLLFYIRKRLRRWYGFPSSSKELFGVPCIFSPVEQVTIGGESSGACVSTTRRSCNYGLGTAAFVTGTFGFQAAAEVVKILTRLES